MSGSDQTLRREVGIPGAVLLGLGSMIGTGVFVSLAFAIDVAGRHIVVAILIAGLLALCNGLSSAQLAATHPVSGGSYEYGYRYLSPAAGFLAGWTFLIAKSASAGTAALGFTAYLFHLLGLPANGGLVASASLVVFGVSLLAWTGIKPSNVANAVLVGGSLSGLAVFVVGSFLSEPAGTFAEVPRHAGLTVRELGYASALVFVAFTGYGRVATMGEEIRNPRRSIPVAVVVTIAVTLIVYLLVALACLHMAGVEATAAAFNQRVAALAVLAEQRLRQPVPGWVALAAALAMLSVLLNLVLGLSRMVLAMARRRDLPGLFSKLNQQRTSPSRAVALVAVILLGWVALQDIRLTWSVSAFTVLIYYGIANLSALQVPAEQRFIPKIVSVMGLIGCVGLAPMVAGSAWLVGGAIVGVGFIGFWAKQLWVAQER